MIDVQQVRELIALMVEHGLSELRIRQGETTISLRRGPAGAVELGAGLVQAPSVPSPGAAWGTPGGPTPAASHETRDEGLVPISSPMVGTFYSAPEPDAPPFVEVGSEVNVDSPVCVIEAMKVFNEIKAEVAGVIERILVQNQQAVEFGQPLMLVRPSH